MRVFEIPKFNHPAFQFYLRRSSYIHIALVACTLISGKVAFDIQKAQRDRNIELISASVRVDMVAMPTQTLNELKNLSSGVEEAKKEEKTEIVKEAEKVVTKEESKEEPKEEPKAIDKTPDTSEAFQEAQAAKKRQNFLSKLKTIGNKKIESEGTLKAEKGAYGEKESALKNLVLSGNKLSKGTSMYGDGAPANATAFQEYAFIVSNIVRPHFKISSYMDKKLKSRIQIWLRPNGEVARLAVYESSGDAEFDQRSMDAVKAASPFPALREEFGKRAQNGDIVLGFPL